MSRNSSRSGSIPRENAVLVGISRPGEPRWVTDDHLDELAALVETAGAAVAGRTVQRRAHLDPATLVGPGKLAEIRETCEATGANLVVLDEEATGSQVRKIEEAVGRKTIDRTEVILEIFARRARTAEAKVQVELAQLRYRLSRLAGKGVLLSRLGGGIGTRGPGETKLEVDRRRIRDRISTLSRRLDGIARRRALRRRGRRGAPVGAVVGYTNAGKSTLVATLAKTDLFAEDRPFATLDAATRRAYLGPGEPPVLLVDTVGFIRKFPPHLAASFRSTLEEAAEADFLVHVVDAAHPRRDEQVETVEATLADLGAADRPTLLVFNKIDLVGDPPLWPGSIAVSARTGEGLDNLKRRIADLALRAEPVGLRRAS